VGGGGELQPGDRVDAGAIQVVGAGLLEGGLGAVSIARACTGFGFRELSLEFLSEPELMDAAGHPRIEPLSQGRIELRSEFLCPKSGLGVRGTRLVDVAMLERNLGSP
jgi:hypothetical protein